MTSYPAFCDHILHQNELVAAGICHGDTWNLIFINNMLGEILKLSPGRMDDEPFLPRLTRCGFDEVEESLSEPHGGELIAHHKEGSMYIIRWKSVSIDDSAGGEQVRLITMSKIPVDQINRVAELPWQELTVLLDSIHDGIWVIDSDGITLRVNKAMERIAGLRAEEVIGKHVTEPMHKGRFETCVTLRALIEKRSVTMFDDYSNGKRCLNTSTPIFDEKGNVWRVIASIRDMTELETLQRKLTDLEMETLAYKARLENLETEMDAGFVGHSAPMQGSLQGRPHRSHHPHPRRNRNRQDADGQGHPRHGPAQRRTVHRGKLRGHPHVAYGIRIVRLRKRRLHRRGQERQARHV